MSWGPNLLIKQGAKLVQEWNDVVVELPAEMRRALIGKAQARLRRYVVGNKRTNSLRLPPELGAGQPGSSRPA